MSRIVTLVLTVAAALGLAVCAQGAVQISTSGWAWGNPTPQGNTLRAMDFIGAAGFAVGDDGTALRTLDGGVTWTGLATGTTADLAGLQAVDANTVLVLGGDGCVLRRSSDGGATFKRLYTSADAGCSDHVAAIRFVSADVGYLFLRDGNVLRTTDGGQSFAKQTALPGTPASPGGATSAVPVGAVFSTADAGLAVLTAPNAAVAYATTDRGTSWKPVTLPSIGTPRQVVPVSASTVAVVGTTAVAISIDGGATWDRHTVPDVGSPLRSIDCFTATACVLTTDRGAVLIRTSDGFKSVATVTASTQPIYAAAYTSPTRVVGAGAGGATVVSDDGGVNFTRVGGDIGGTYTRLRPGASALSAYAVGSRGALARTLDGGASWQALSVPTSVDLADAVFGSSSVGYALDTRGGLFKTANGGETWQTLDPGTTAARAIGALSSDTVVLVARTGLRRQTGGGRFVAVSDRDVTKANLTDIDVNSGSAVVFGSRALAISTDRGATWRALRRPSPGGKMRNGLAISDVDFGDARHGYLLDRTGRVWRTSNGAKSWTRLDGVGSADGVSLAFGAATSGFLELRRFGDDPSHAYVLRTSDSGRTWRPQLISVGAMPQTAIAATSASRAFALVPFAAKGTTAAASRLLSTSSGGDAGKTSTLTLSTKRRLLTGKQLGKAHGQIVLTGALAGAVGGERIVVSMRDGATGRWRHQVVTAGANLGSFTTSWKLSRTSQFVAQWAGDSGRRGLGSTVLTIRVR